MAEADPATADGTAIEVACRRTVLHACELAGKEDSPLCYHERLSVRRRLPHVRLA